jgi:DinB superfamily
MDPRYPIGRYQRPASIDAAVIHDAIATIAESPARLTDAVAGLKADQLDTPYREGGWTVRQVVHHVPESHLNAYIRCKLALTEDVPTIKPYEEGEWAKLRDVAITPIGVSLLLLDALHARWVSLLRTLEPHDWQRTFRHPESGVWRVDELATLYAWHGAHHVAHITTLRQQKGW